MRIAVFFPLLFGLAASPAAGDDKIDYATARQERRLTMVQISSGITLDGALDEASWRDAPVASGFIQNDPREGEAATFDTEVRILYDGDAIYFGVFGIGPATSSAAR